MTDKYQSGALLRQYLDFHYLGESPDYLPHHPLPPQVLGFPRRCADWTARHALRHGRVLDLGCAVGAASFVLAREFSEVIGIDSSTSFIAAARELARSGVFRTSESAWEVFSDVRKTVPDFRVGDAAALPGGLGVFDAVLMANLLCRLSDPGKCLEGLRPHVAAGSVLVLLTPGSWDEAYTPADRQLVPMLPALKARLESWCDLLEIRSFPFVLREHARKAEFTVALGTAWRVKPGQAPVPEV